MSEKDNLPLGFCCDMESSNDPLYFANVSDSDSTSPESEDSLELSESESITDVTPLNSPYCDSPQPQARSADLSQMKDPYDESKNSEMNVLMQAIRKLEVENNQNRTRGSSSRKKKSDPCSSDSSLRMETDSSLLKHAMSQQGRVRASSSHDRLLHRKSTVINRHRQLSSAGAEAKVASSVRSQKELSQGQSRRQMKCLSHPSCSPYSYAVLENTVRCGKELKSIDCSQSGSLKVASDSVPNIDSDVIAH